MRKRKRKKKTVARSNTAAPPRKKPVKKKKKAVKPKKSRVPKVRGSETYTEAGFWGMIKNCLRRQSRWWKPVSNVRMKARRAYNGPNKRQKFEYCCNICKGWFPATGVQIDHIVPVGSLQKYEDLAGVVERLFCEEHGLQCICTSCHSVKTEGDLINMKIKKEENV